LAQYQAHLANDKRFIIPTVHEALSNDSILAMDFVQGGVFQASCRKNHVILLIFSGLRIWVQFNRINRRPISCFF
jgi:hypothetical protein